MAVLFYFCSLHLHQCHPLYLMISLQVITMLGGCVCKAGLHPGLDILARTLEQNIYTHRWYEREIEKWVGTLFFAIYWVLRPSTLASWTQPWCRTKIFTYIVMIYSYDIGSYEWRFCFLKGWETVSISPYEFQYTEKECANSFYFKIPETKLQRLKGMEICHVLNWWCHNCISPIFSDNFEC